MTMTHTLLFLFDLLTNSQAVAALVRDLLAFGTANTGFACFLGSLEILRRSRLRQNQTAFSRA
jgi:hypothetical protein